MSAPPSLSSLDEVIVHLLRQARAHLDAVLVDERMRLEKPGVLIAATHYLDAAMVLTGERDQLSAPYQARSTGGPTSGS